MEITLEVLRHLVSNDHGELTAIVVWLADNATWLRVAAAARLAAWRG